MKLRNKKTWEITRDDDWDFVGLVLKVNRTYAVRFDDGKIDLFNARQLYTEWGEE